MSRDGMFRVSIPGDPCFLAQERHDGDALLGG